MILVVLTQQYNHIKALLDSLNLYKFSIVTISFGGVLAYYLMFYFPERVTKALIHDFHYNSSSVYKDSSFFVKEISTKNWIIPKKSSIAVIFLLHKGSFVQQIHVLELMQIFTKIKFVFFMNVHSIEYKRFKIMHHIGFFIFNMKTIKQLWNYQAKSFILNTDYNKQSKRNKILTYIFLWIYKTHKNKI